jgi:hypothetical protein
VATTADGMKGDQHRSHSEKGGCDWDPCMECRQACLLRQSGLLVSCTAATLGQRKARVLLLRTGMLIDISTASLCSFLETIGDAGEHVGRSNAAPSTDPKHSQHPGKSLLYHRLSTLFYFYLNDEFFDRDLALFKSSLQSAPWD